MPDERTRESPFPLALTPHERLHWRIARPGYPTVFSVWTKLVGDVDERRLDAALSSSVTRHPLLAAVVGGRGRRARWRPAPRADVRVAWTADSRTPIAPLDVERSPGIHVVGSRRGDGVDLVIHFHHACCDGVAAIDFLGDVFAAYAGGPERPLDPRLLARRGIRGNLYRPRARRVALSGTSARALAFRPSVLAADRQQRAGEDHDSLYRLPNLRLDSRQTAALRALAHAEGGTLNDLLLAECFLAVGRWNADHGGSDRIRLLMPVSKRTSAHAELPAANVLSFEPIDRRVPGGVDRAELRASVRRETGAVKRREEPSWLDDWIGLMHGYPPTLDALLALPISLYTGIVSNLGTPAERAWPHLPQRDGRLTFEGFEVAAVGFAPPVRPRSRISLGIMTYGGELSITGKACPRTIGAPGLERFLDRLGAQLDDAAKASRAGETAMSP